MMSASSIPRLRIVHFNDIYELSNLPRLQTFLSKISPAPNAVVLAGDFLSPSTLSSLDGGKGMVQTLRAVGLTHASLGNHEADLRLPRLERRLKELSMSVKVLNSNIEASPEAPWLQGTVNWMHPYSIVESDCHRVRAALVGLMSDEEGVFRDGTFRGATIRNVPETVDELHKELVVESKQANIIIPLTHETIQRDRELAQHMLDMGYGSGIVLGGHEHSPYDVLVSKGGEHMRILKSGSEAAAVDLVDLSFDLQQEDGHPRLAQVDAQLIEMSDFAPSVVVQKIVDSHMSLLDSMENEDIFHAEHMLPPGVPLSSVGSRCRQTTVGGILCTSIKEELEANVAMINGSSLKGNTDYKNNAITYAQLKKELPFPTKMVVIPMKRWQLHEAIHYSRSYPPSDDPKFQRKGFLQVDAEFDRIGFHTGGQDDDIMVALPRNILNGFCHIQPLIEIGNALKAQGTFPDEDDFIPAIDLVVRRFCKERWYELVQDQLTFADLDREKKGFLSRSDVQRMLRKAIGHEPPDFVVTDMIAAIDADQDGTIDRGEFSYLLAEMEREHGFLRFD